MIIKWQKQKLYLYVIVVDMNLPNGLVNVLGCNEWNSFYEEKIKKESSNVLIKGETKKSSIPKNLNDVIGKDATRIGTGLAELDRVLGGGLVKGSLVLVGGEPRNWKIYTYITIM